MTVKPDAYSTGRLFSMYRVILLVGLISLSLVLSGCGFKLRGSLELSPDIAPVYVQENSAFTLGKDIRDLLASNKLNTTASATESKTQINLNREARSRKILSVDGSGRAREYLLQYSISFSITIDPMEPVEETLTTSRSLLFDPDAVLAVTNEAEVVYRDMQREIARMILLRLQAQAHSQARPEVSDAP